MYCGNTGNSLKTLSQLHTNITADRHEIEAIHQILTSLTTKNKSDLFKLMYEHSLIYAKLCIF